MSGKVFGPVFGMEKPVPYISTQFTVKRTTFNYHKVDDKKVELPEGWDLKSLFLNNIKKHVHIDRITTEFLSKRANFDKASLLNTMRFQEPEIELNHVWKENGISVIEGQFTLNIKPPLDDDICFQVQIPFTPIGEDEHISDYEIHSFYYEDKLRSVCTSLFWSVINYLEKF